MPLWEPETQFWRSVRDLPRVLTPSTVSAGLVAALMGVTGPTLLVYQAAANAGYSTPQIGSWFLAIFAGGGALSLLLALAYRIPAAGAYSIAGSALLLQSLPAFDVHEAVGAYLLSAALIGALAVTGWFERLLRWIPVEVVMGMLAGVLLRFGVEIFRALVDDPWLVGPVVAAFVLCQRNPRRFPPVTVALAVGVVLALVLHPWPAGGIALRLARPLFVGPAFTLDAFLSLSLPLALLALSSQNATGIGVLWAYGYRAPVHAVTAATAVFSAATAPLLGHGINLATPMTAICADPHSHADPARRYGAAVANGLFFIAFGVLGLTLVTLVRVLPQGLIVAVAGLALVPIIQQSLEQAFRGEQRRLGALFALVVAASDIRMLGVGAAFWALVLATAVTLIVERPRAAAASAKEGAAPE